MEPLSRLRNRMLLAPQKLPVVFCAPGSSPSPLQVLVILTYAVHSLTVLYSVAIIMHVLLNKT